MDEVVHGSTGVQDQAEHFVPGQQEYDLVGRKWTKSAGKRLRALNIRYFFVTDQVQKGKVEVEYCPTKQMWADPMTKPLQGSDFKISADGLMGRLKD